MYNCCYCNKIFTTKSGRTQHMKYCKLNPDCSIYIGHKVSEETRKKISEGMKKAHYEGRHNGWANTRKNKNGMSYPELWFSSVIENEIKDQNFEYNLPVGHYKLDFAWPKKMRYIEIDGSQHSDTKEYDSLRDEWLKNKGWYCLRLSWSLISQNKESFITLVKSFIDDVEDLPENLQFRDSLKEKQSIRNNCIAEGKINSLGRACPQMIALSTWEERKNLILNCGVDLSKFGCLKLVEEKTGLTRRQVKSTVDKFNIEYKTHKY